MSDSSPPPDRLGSWLAEIRRRRVFRVTGAYVLVAWILMQAGEIVFPAFELPNSALRILIVSLIAGLPCVIVMAWFLDVTPTGIRLTRRFSDSLTEESSEASSSNEHPADEAGQAPSPPTTSGGPSLEILLLGIVVPLFAFAILLGYFTLRMENVPDNPPSAQAIEVDSSSPSLAVLPFDDLSSAASDGGFFARGMHEDILTHLSRVQSLKLISRTSVMGYQGTTQNLREIGRALGVNHILEGSVRRTETRVRVTAQLIRADTDEHLWAKNFDAELEDVFAVQTEIAEAIALALESELAPASTKISETVVPAAYDAYLKARDLHRNLDANDRFEVERIRHLYETALQADPNLVAAHLQLAILHAQTRWFEFDLSEDRGRLARANLAEAVRLGVSPDQHALAEGVLAYYLDRDFGKALLHFEEAERRAPGNAEAIFYRAMILRRVGELEAALEAQRRALELDPLNLAHRDELAMTLAFVGQLEEARVELEDVLRTDPDRTRAQLQKWQLDLELDGRPQLLLKEMLSQSTDGWQDPHYSLLETVAILADQPALALEQIEKRRPANPDSGFRDYQRAVLEGARGNPEDSKGWLARAWRKFRAMRAPSGSPSANDRARSVEALLSAQEGDLDLALTLQQEIVARNPIEKDLVEGAPPPLATPRFPASCRPTPASRRTYERLTTRVAPGSILNGGYYVLRQAAAYADARADGAWSAVISRTLPEYTHRWLSSTSTRSFDALPSTRAPIRHTSLRVR